MLSSAAPISSMPRARPPYHSVSRINPDKVVAFMDSRIIMRSRRETRRPSASITRVAKIINPRPPVWISAISTHCPKSENVGPVSTTTSPVTHTAEVAVNRPLNNPIL